MKLDELISKQRQTALVILVDPDKFNPELIKLAEKGKTKFFLVGGSKLKKNNTGKIISQIKKISNKPVILFPGDETQISNNADGLLMLSLISGRNPEYLIGKHVKAAAKIKKNKLSSWPTGYILIEGKNISATQKVTSTKGISPSKTKTILNTALAGELLGMKSIYLEAGSGAVKTIQGRLIKLMKQNLTIPLFVGGGIDSVVKAGKIMEAKPDYMVIGNALEKNIYLLTEIEKLF